MRVVATRSFITSALRAANAGLGTVTGATCVPRGISPKYFSTTGLALAAPISHGRTNTALFGPSRPVNHRLESARLAACSTPPVQTAHLPAEVPDASNP